MVVQNFGNVNVSDFDIAYGLPGGFPININVVGKTVPARDTVHHTFRLKWIPVPPFNNPFYHLYAYTTGIPDANHSNDTACLPVIICDNVQELNWFKLSCSPNPAIHWVHLSWDAIQMGAIKELVGYDRAGVQVFRESITSTQYDSGTFRLSVLHVPAGLYSLQLRGEKGFATCRLLVVN
jgi:hypothetical protein